MGKAVGKEGRGQDQTEVAARSPRESASTPLVLSPKTMSKINQPGTQIKYVCFRPVNLLGRVLQGPSSGHFKADLSGPRHAPFLLCLPG